MPNPTNQGGFLDCGVDGRGTTSRVVPGVGDGEGDGVATTTTGLITCLVAGEVKYWPPIIGIDPDLRIGTFINQQKFNITNKYITNYTKIRKSRYTSPSVWC